jgi:hypothetical protein
MKKTILTVVTIATIRYDTGTRKKFQKITFWLKAGLNLSNASVDRAFDT